MRPLVPRPHHEETSWEEQESWKKKLALETQTIQTENPDADVEVWTMDEQTLEDSLPLTLVPTLLRRYRFANATASLTLSLGAKACKSELYGHHQENSQLPQLIGDTSGYGCMVLYIPTRVKLRRGFYLTCGLTYLILF